MKLSESILIGMVENWLDFGVSTLKFEKMVGCEKLVKKIEKSNNLKLITKGIFNLIPMILWDLKVFSVFRIDLKWWKKNLI